MFIDCEWISEFDEEGEYENLKKQTLRIFKKFALNITNKLNRIDISFDEI